jgi:hypothetical protein
MPELLLKVPTTAPWSFTPVPVELVSVETGTVMVWNEHWEKTNGERNTNQNNQPTIRILFFIDISLSFTNGYGSALFKPGSRKVCRRSNRAKISA